jgi:hypothetical protein
MVEDKANGGDLHDMVWYGVIWHGQPLPLVLKFDPVLLFQ